MPEAHVPGSMGVPKVGTSNPSTLGTVIWEEITLAIPLGPHPGKGSLSYSESYRDRSEHHQNSHRMDLSSQYLAPHTLDTSFHLPGAVSWLRRGGVDPGRVQEAPLSSDSDCPFCPCCPLVKGEPRPMTGRVKEKNSKAKS